MMCTLYSWIYWKVYLPWLISILVTVRRCPAGMMANKNYELSPGCTDWEVVRLRTDMARCSPSNGFIGDLGDWEEGSQTGLRAREWGRLCLRLCFHLPRRWQMDLICLRVGKCICLVCLRVEKSSLTSWQTKEVLEREVSDRRAC